MHTLHLVVVVWKHWIGTRFVERWVCCAMIQNLPLTSTSGRTLPVLASQNPYRLQKGASGLVASRSSRQTMTSCAVAAEPATLKIYKASSMTDAQLREATARPRVDFSSILGVVRIGTFRRI